MTQLTIDSEQLDQLILQRLPTLMQQNSQIQELILDLARQNFADRQATDDRFYQLLGELRRDREEQSRQWQEYIQEQNRKWEEQRSELSRQWQEYIQEQDRKWKEQKSELSRQWQEYTQKQDRKWEEQRSELSRQWQEYIQEQDRKWEKQDRKWDEQDRKWEEQNRKWEDAKREFDRMHEEIMAIAKKYDRSIGAIGARWGIKSENSFRNALVGILEQSFGVQVLNINDYDDEGEVFGRPDQIELDVIIKNGLLIICEIKSSIDKAGIYIFERKVRFYEKKHQRAVTRMLVISPMVEAKAERVAEQLGIEIYSDSMEVKEL